MKDEFEKWLIQENEDAKAQAYLDGRVHHDHWVGRYNSTSDCLAKYRAFKAEPKRGLPRQDSTTDQLVDVMKAANKMGCYDAADVIRGIIERKAYKFAATEARRLAAEEKAQKPTAPASLVEEIKTYCENITGPRQDGSATIKAQCFNEGAKVAGLEVLKILSRYRPAPPGGQGGSIGVDGK